MTGEPILVDVYAAAAHVRLAYDLVLAPATIHQWVHRGLITRHDGLRGRRRRVMVDLIEIDRRVETRCAVTDQDLTPVPVSPRRPTRARTGRGCRTLGGRSL